MDNNDKIKKSITESIIVISIMALYIVYGIHFLPLLMLFIPLPFVVLGVRNNIYINGISMIISFIIAGLLLGVASNALLILIFVPLSLIINYCIIKRKTTMEIISASTLIFFLSIVMLMFLGVKISDLDLTKQLENDFTRILTVQIDMFRDMGMTNHEILQTKDLLETAYRSIIVLIPSMLGIISLIISSINVFLSSIILRKMGYGIVGAIGFSKFKLPKNIIPGILVMFMAAFIIKQLGIEYHDALLYNLTFLVSFAFLLQGLAVVDFLLKKSKVRLVFRILIIGIMILFIPMSSIILFLGILDTVFDTRKLRRLKS
ncbi:YybS family protein [Tissierella pigra]|uniref:DUF2232 domain-containing protein n=1 Tax=Tissierella pigra TaxID=2607614 RepID=A0A6N7XYU3_9FIRM|nr:DUF2232 domain-containing protein [Tissierella pigra]MBU5428331.1 YybS family protein [Tissierella pigra]MSU01655.1 DUF2232 domain-containing protein [Tissierella pigra]